MGFYDRHKHHREDQSLHVDDWLMTYADMITLLLCFFAVFLSVSVPKTEQMNEAHKKIQEEFAGPDKTGGYMHREDILAGKFPPVVVKRSADPENMPYDNLPSIVDKFRQEGVTVTQGDKITTINVDSKFFFTSGASSISIEGQNFLKGLLEPLLHGQFREYLITVEGHTDDNPINTIQFPSNWELSTARASSVVRFFMEQGVLPQRLRAAGYADVFPQVPNRDTKGQPIPENQAQNRRVVIKLEKIEKQKAINP